MGDIHLSQPPAYSQPHFQLFSSITTPPTLPPHCHLHAAVEFSLPFYIFPFPPNFGHMALQSIDLLCGVHCCPLLGTTECYTD